jgi:hypothetical protein
MRLCVVPPVKAFTHFTLLGVTLAVELGGSP